MKRFFWLGVAGIALVSFIGMDVVKSAVKDARDSVRGALTKEVPLETRLAEARARIDTYAESGLLGPNESKVIDVSDGYDLAGVAIPALADAVPAEATAITYNIAVAGTTGTNFVSATAGDATEFNTAVLNYGEGVALSNSATVPVDATQQIKVWGGDQVGSAHVIIDVTGYHAAPVLPNMGN